jgi:uncharacterized phage protein (TIGR02218 family)
MRAAVGDFPLWSNAIALADLWTITLADGAVLRWTSADVPIAAGGETYSCGPVITRGGTRLTSTLEVDTLDVTFGVGGPAGSPVSLGGVPLPHAAAAGAFDGAGVKLERAFMVTWGTAAATVHLFEGRVAGVEPRHTEVAVQVKSLLEILDAKWPRGLYQPACNHRLYGQGCGADRAAVTASGVADGGARARIDWPNAAPAGYYEQGVIAFTSGANTGERRTVKTSGPAGVTVFPPFAHPVRTGDAFTIAPGCTKTRAGEPGDARPSCAEHGGLAHFRGFPYVPPPENAR